MIACSSDAPLLGAATATMTMTSTPLEADSAAFVVQQAHNSRVVFSVRELATGAARDVSGVLGATRGGSAYQWLEEDGRHNDAVPEMEALYLVQRDGNVKVFERGSGQ